MLKFPKQDDPAQGMLPLGLTPAFKTAALNPSHRQTAPSHTAAAERNPEMLTPERPDPVLELVQRITLLAAIARGEEVWKDHKRMTELLDGLPQTQQELRESFMASRSELERDPQSRSKGKNFGDFAQRVHQELLIAHAQSISPLGVHPKGLPFDQSLAVLNGRDLLQTPFGETAQFVQLGLHPPESVATAILDQVARNPEALMKVAHSISAHAAKQTMLVSFKTPIARLSARFKNLSLPERAGPRGQAIRQQIANLRNGPELTPEPKYSSVKALESYLVPALEIIAQSELDRRRDPLGTNSTT